MCTDYLKHNLLCELIPRAKKNKKEMKLFMTTLLITIIYANGCFEVERDALLTFKAGLHDPGGLMSSWHGQDCCNWTGITCHDVTKHVVKLNLTNSYYSSYLDGISHALTGELNPALLSLQRLTHLQLSNHDFSNFSVPKFIGSFENLVYLNLSFSEFQGPIPYELGNLSRLQFLDLGGSQFTGMVPPQLGNLSNLQYLRLMSYSFSLSANNSQSWLVHLSNLRYLDMSYVSLSNTFNWAAINKMHLLETLILSCCDLSEIPIDLSHSNLTFLKKLDISENSFNATLPNWLWSLTGLLYLDLGYNEFHGSIPWALTNLASLNYLGIGGNNFEPLFLEPMSNLINLKGLHLSSLEIKGGIVDLIKKLDPMWHNLDSVDLGDNYISGNLSSSIALMRNLSTIYLFENFLSSDIPSEIGTLTRLQELDLSYNSLSGVITETHFVNLSNLKGVDLSNNNKLTMKINDSWMPPFQLEYLSLGSCKVGPKLPSWLRGQTRIQSIDLSNTSITGVIPNWFWNMSNLESIDLSNNNIMGNLPKFFQFSQIIYLKLKYNNITGPILSIPNNIFVLDLSENQIVGNIPYELCDIKNIELLDLSTNAISGEIPNCWSNTSNLAYIDLSNNQITGELPTSIGSLQNLITLQLYNNKLYGEIPSTLQQCKNLVFLSLGKNNISGEIPSWIGKQLHNLVVLQLRSNKFNGFIPLELGDLSNLHILDLARNSLVGPIPSSIANFSSMKNSSQCFSFTWGGVLYVDIDGQYVYTSMPLDCAKFIDISGNNINGEISKELWLLQGLMNINLSKNHLIGEISNIIGDMRSLESLDLSFNNLSNLLPQTISELFSLHNLNLSYNNFSGKIPTGRQLDTLSDPSIYIGNPYLCGPPTNKNCYENQVYKGVDSDHDDNTREMVWFFLVLILGFILGFWTFWGALIFQNDWKVAHFEMFDRLFDEMYVHTRLALRRLVCW